MATKRINELASLLGQRLEAHVEVLRTAATVRWTGGRVRRHDWQYHVVIVRGGKTWRWRDPGMTAAEVRRWLGSLVEAASCGVIGPGLLD